MSEQLTGRELDAEVARVVFGIDVLGQAEVWAPECCWEIYGPVVPGSGRETAYVYAGHCCCEHKRAEDADILGHASFCLEIVENYSDSWQGAGLVLERMREQGRDGELWLNPSRLRPWSARFENADGQLLFRDWRYGDTGPDAIARAALVTKEGGT